MERQGQDAWCIETAVRLETEGVHVGLTGPSFDCALAMTSTERAICDDPRLWARDRAVASLYASGRRAAPVERKEALLDIQRSWIRWRDSCGGDLQCLIDVYERRLEHLSF